jgi:metallophosphoesterase superfamily enzyme
MITSVTEERMLVVSDIHLGNRSSPPFIASHLRS